MVVCVSRPRYLPLCFFFTRMLQEQLCILTLPSNLTSSDLFLSYKVGKQLSNWNISFFFYYLLFIGKTKICPKNNLIACWWSLKRRCSQRHFGISTGQCHKQLTYLESFHSSSLFKASPPARKQMLKSFNPIFELALALDIFSANQQCPMESKYSITVGLLDSWPKYVGWTFFGCFF